MVQRLAPENAGVKRSGAHIEQLSLGVYDSVRRLLGRLRPRQLDDLTPVSYTHLDVYKRQVPHCIQHAANQRS